MFRGWCRDAEVADVHLGDFGDLDEDLLGCRWVALDLARKVASVTVILVTVVIDLCEDYCDGVLRLLDLILERQRGLHTTFGLTFKKVLIRMLSMANCSCC